MCRKTHLERWATGLNPVAHFAGRISAVTAFVVSALMACAGQPHRPGMTVTYVASAGFIVECGGTKFLVDALLKADTSQWYYAPSDSVEELMRTARPPFDNVDLIAITHAHVDHFDPDVVSLHMRQDTGAVLICPPQVEDKMQASPYYGEIRGRIRAVAAPPDSVVTMDIGGIQVSAFSGHHSPYYELSSATGESVDRHRNVQHLEFLFRAGGRTVFDCGDAVLNDFERYSRLGLSRDSVDLALIHMWRGGERLSFEQKLVHDVIRPQCVILMHLVPGLKPPGDPEKQEGIAREIIVPKQLMQTWSFD